MINHRLIIDIKWETGSYIKFDKSLYQAALTNSQTQIWRYTWNLILNTYLCCCYNLQVIKSCKYIPELMWVYFKVLNTYVYFMCTFGSQIMFHECWTQNHKNIPCKSMQNQFTISGQYSEPDSISPELDSIRSHKKISSNIWEKQSC